MIRQDEAESQEVFRLDVGSLGKLEKTPQGGYFIPAVLTRVGVFSYYENGKQVREYRPPEEVFHADSLATLPDAPVTDMHPPERLVTPSNYSTRVRGHVQAGSVRQDGSNLVARLAVQDERLIGDIEDGKKRETSCGYRCRMDETPGTTPEGEKYDRVQRGIRYNHVAVVTKGRAGNSVLRLDEAGNQIPDEIREERKAMLQIRIDGVDFPMNTEAEIKAALQAFQRFQVKTDGEIAELKKQRDEARGKVTALETTNSELQTKLDEATNVTKLDARVQERTQLVERAKALGLEKPEGTDEQIMRAVVSKRLPDVRLDGASSDFIRGLFSGLTPAGTNTTREIRRGATPEPPTKSPEETKQDGKGAAKPLWQQPLAVSKG